MCRRQTVLTYARQSSSSKEGDSPPRPNSGGNNSERGNRNRDRRLIPFVLSTPLRIEEYFDEKPARKLLWCAISAGAGFYSGNTVTLSFGALAINDVLAAVITLLFYELVSRAFYSSPNRPLRLWMANFFKIGVTMALMADAIKLGG